MTKIYIFLFVALQFLFVKPLWSQVTLFSENFGSTASVLPTGWTASGSAVAWTTFTSGVSAGYTGASGAAHLRSEAVAGTKILTYSNNLSTVGYTNIQVIWGGRRTATMASPIFEWSTDGSVWNTVTFTDVAANATWALVNNGTPIALPTGAEGAGNLQFRWTATVVGSSGYRIDDFVVTGTQGVLSPTKLAIESINNGSIVMENQAFSVTVRSLDANNTYSNVQNNTDIAISLNSGTGSLSGTLTGTITAGTNSATINGILYNQPESAISLQAASTAGDVLSSAISQNFSVHGNATYLEISGLTATANAGTIIPQFTISAKDIAGNVDITFNQNVSITKTSGTGNIVGTTTVQAISGVATFSDIAFDAADTYTFSATSGSLTQANSANIDVSASLAPATILSFNNVPASGYLNTNIASFTVEALRADSSTDANYTADITIEKYTGAGILSGTLTKPAINGIATFNDIQFNANDNYKLRATSGTLIADTTLDITITDAPVLPVKLLISDISGVIVNSTFNVIVKAVDASGNPANVSANTDVTISKLTGTGTLSGTLTATISAGTSEITFSNFTYNKWETGISIKATSTGLEADTSNTFSTELQAAALPTSFDWDPAATTYPAGWYNDGLGFYTSAASSHLAPNAGQFNSAGDRIVVHFAGEADSCIFWIKGNSVTTPLIFSTLKSADGINFDTIINYNSIPGIYTRYSVPLSSDARYFAIKYVQRSAGNIAIDDVIITARTYPVKLKIVNVNNTVNPTVGSSFNVVVKSLNSNGVPATVVTPTNITLLVNSGTGNLSGSINGTIAAGSNEIIFPAVIYDKAESNVRIEAGVTSGDALLADTSMAFDVLDTASALEINGFANSGYTNTNIPFFSVKAVRADNTTDFGYSGAITISKATGPGTITGTLTRNAINGIAVFNDIAFDTEGTYTISATSGFLSSATSTDIIITIADTIAHFVKFAGLPLSGDVNTPLSAFSVAAMKVNNTIDTFYTGDITLTKYAGNGLISGTTTVTCTGGVAHFNDITFDQAGSYKLIASSGALSNDTSHVIFIKNPTLTEVFVPAYIQGKTGTNSARVPYAFRVNFENMLPNSTYNFFYRMDTTTTDVSAGAGIMIVPTQSGSFIRINSQGLTNPANYSTFITDNNGSYSGWFMVEPTQNIIFKPGNSLYVKFSLNDGAGGTLVDTKLNTSTAINVVNFAASVSDTTCSALWGLSNGTPRNFILTYDNEEGTGRPISSAVIENNELVQTTSFASFYVNNVDGVNGAWGTIIPNNLPYGVRRIEQRSIADGSLVGCATDANGLWNNNTASTVNSTAGINSIDISSSAGSLNACTMPVASKLIISNINNNQNPVINTPFDIEILSIDANGDLRPVSSTVNISLNLHTGTGTLSGTTTGIINAGNSSALISGVLYNVPETGVQIIANDMISVLSADTSNSLTFIATPPVPSNLAILSVNNNSNPQLGIPFDVVVQIQDSTSTPVTLQNPMNISISLNSGTGTLSGVLTGTISAGNHTYTFTGLSYNVAETGVSLIVSEDINSVTPAVSNIFAVETAPFALKITDVNSGADAIFNTPFSVTVEAVDANGQPVNANSNINVGISLVNGSGVLSGTLTGVILSGNNSVVFTNIIYNMSEQGITIKASAAGLVNDTSSAFNVIMPAATLPTSFSWNPPTSPYPTGWYNTGLGSYVSTGNTDTYSGKLDTQGDELLIYFDNTASIVSYNLKSQSLAGAYQFDVSESSDGINYSLLLQHTSATNTILSTFSNFTAVPLSSSRYIKFTYTVKSAGNIAIDDILIDKLTEVNNLELTSDIKLFPNPVKQSFTLTNVIEITGIEVCSLLGQVIERIEAKGSQLSVNAENLKSGSYFLKLTLKNGRTVVKKFSKI